VSLAGSLRSKNINDHDRLDEPAHHQHQSMLGMLDGGGAGEEDQLADGDLHVGRIELRPQLCDLL
ncbi:hypothetical protein, partial [Allorhizobium taibaishanense]